MKLTVEVEADRQMLETIIELWKAKWNEEEVEDDDAEDEPEDCDDDSEDEAIDSEAEEEAHRKALDELEKHLRNSGIAFHSVAYCRHAGRRKRRM